MTNTLRLSGKYQPTIQQRGIITQLTNDTLSEVSYIVKLAFLVSPAIDPRRLERAFAKLAARHEAIRQSFVSLLFE